MSPERFLLDTSAALTLIEDEAGAARVEDILRSAETLLAWPSLMEVSYISQQEKGQPEAERRYALLKQAVTAVLWHVDEPLLLTAARLKAQHHVSFADAVIAAYAVREDATLVHKDPEYDCLAGQVRMEALPYKAHP